MFKRVSIVILFFAILFNTIHVYAQIRTAIASTDWDVPGTWDCNCIPGAGEDAVIPAGFTVTLTSDQTITNLTVSGTINFNTANRTLNANTLLFTGAGAADLVGTNNNRVLNVAGTTTIDPGTNADIGGIQINLTGLTTVNGTLTFASTTGTKTLGDITISAAGTWDNDNVNEDIISTGTLTNNNAVGNFIAGTGTYNFTGGANSFNGPIAIPNIDIDGGYTNNGTLTVSTALAGGGSLTQAAATTLNIGDGGTFALTTLNASIASGAGAGNTVNYNGTSAQTIANIGYENLTVTNTCGGCTVNGTGTYTVNGNFFIDDADVVTTSDITVNGNTTIDEATATLRTGSGVANFGGTTTITNGTLEVSSSTGASEIFNNIVVGAGGTFNNSSNETITVSGSITNNNVFTSGTGLYTLSGAAQSLNGASLTIASAAITGSYTNNITAAAGFSVTTALSGAGTLTQAAGADLLLGGTSTITALVATAAGNLVTYNQAAGAQTVYDTDYYDLRINKAAGDASLGGSIFIDNQLTMSSGDLNLLGFNLTLDNDATVSGGSSTSYINTDLDNAGRLIVDYNSTGSRTFPIGDATGTGYSPLTINITSGTFAGGSNLSIAVQNAKAPSNNSPTDYINRYWSVTNTGITAFTYNFSATYLAGDAVGSEANYLGGLFDPVISGYRGTEDVNEAGAGGLISGTAMENFNSITAGEANSFPIELCCLKAELKNPNDILISWKTLSEKNCDRFVIERRGADTSFSWQPIDSIATKSVNGFSIIELSYEIMDRDLPAGTWYYRLKEIGNNNSIYYYPEIIFAVIKPYEMISVFSNTHLLFDRSHEYRIYTLNGKLVRNGNNRVIDLYGLARGMYMLHLEDKTVKLVVIYGK